MMRIAVAFFLLCSLPSWAPEYEIQLEGSATVGGIVTGHPLTGPLWDRNTVAVMPRGSLGARWGINHAFDLGVEFEASYMPLVTFPDTQISIGGVPYQGILKSTAVFGDIVATAVYNFQLDFEPIPELFVLDAFLGVEAGPIVGIWWGNVLASPTDAIILGSERLLPQPVVGGTLRITGGAKLRLWGFLLYLEPSVGMTWANSLMVDASIGFRPAFPFYPRWHW